MLEWTPGTKHPDTPAWIFKNVWAYNKILSVIKNRCAICNDVIWSDEDKQKKLVIKCGKKTCSCAKTLSDQIHVVCEVCYDMWHALYFNGRLTNKKYFKELDEEDDKHFGSDARRRMGL